MHLPLQIQPQESHGRLRVFRQRPSLLAFVVGEKRHPPRIHPLHQHRPRAHLTRRIHRPQDQRIRLQQFRCLRFQEPQLQLDHGIRRHVRPAERFLFIITAKHRRVSIHELGGQTG